MSAKGVDSNTKPKNYFGSIAGAICAGPVDELLSFIIDKKTVWPTDKGWADDVFGLEAIRYRREDNVARVEFAAPHRLSKGKSFILSGMADSDFDTSGVDAVLNSNATIIQYANVGADVAWTSTDQGALTKVVHYEEDDLVRFAGGIWKCLSEHDGTPDKMPPNPTYWETYSVLRADSPNPLVIDIADSIQAYGRAYFYWGTEDQTLRDGTFLKGHSNYRRIAFFELENFFFGPERQGPPNIEVVVRKKPTCGTIITGDALQLDSRGQANPIAATCDLLLDPVFGPGHPESLFDQESWQETADALLDDSEKVFISPIIDARITSREFIATILPYYDGWFRFNPNGAIEAGMFAHNEAPPSFPASKTIDFNDVLNENAYEVETWTDVFTEATCKFTDAARAFVDAGRTARSGLPREVVGEARPSTLDRPWIMWEAQGVLHASEWIKVYSQRKISGNLKVRAEKATSIRQGDLFLFTHDAGELSVVCRCMEKTIDAPPNGAAWIRFESERGIAPVPFQPTLENPKGSATSQAELLDVYQFVQPPPILPTQTGFELVVLVARKSSLTRGHRLWLTVDDSNGFYQLGEQLAWAVHGKLAQDYADNLPALGTDPPDDDTETLQLNLNEFHAEEDVEAIFADQTEDAINDDNLLVWLFSAADPTQFEICTVKSIRIDAGVYKLKVRRARFGTSQLAFEEDDSAFIIFKKDLRYYYHSLFPQYAISETPATFRLQSFTPHEEADLTDEDVCPDIEFTFMDPFKPTTTWVLTQVNGVDVADFSGVFNRATIAHPGDVFKLGFNLVAPSGNLRDANLIAKLGGTEINLWSRNFEDTGFEYGEVEFTLPTDGTWTFCMVLRDDTGRVSRTLLYAVGDPNDTQTITIETNSSIVHAPYALPTRNPRTGRIPTVITFNVTLACVTAGSDIHYQIESLDRDDVPTEPNQTLPGAWTTYAGPFSISVHLRQIKRIWMFATKAGMTNSPTVYQNY
jgi:hypothetical protein